MSALLILFLKLISHAFGSIWLSNYIIKYLIPYNLKIIGTYPTLNKKWRLEGWVFEGITNGADMGKKVLKESTREAHNVSLVH